MKRSLASLTKKIKSGPVVETTEGLVMGKTADKGRMNIFAGIPYAAPPLGEFRWQAPQPAARRDETLSCTKPGPIPHQRAQTMDEFIGNLVGGLGIPKAKQRALSSLMKAVPKKVNEDCLTLGIRAPAAASNLPVMVWIHGGDHTDGSGSDILYASNVLPARGCVLVQINYRLGLFGFMGHPDLAKESDDGVSGNYGLLDQVAALTWVRDNIGNFGGNPANVTIFGESAGGEAVLNLMTSPRARGLFHAAIAQSPSDSGRWLHLRQPMLGFQALEEAGAEFATSIVGAEAGQIERMRSESAEDLYDRYRSNEDLGRHFYPAVDGAILPTTPMTAFSNQNQAPVPLMIGYNADEGSMFVGLMHPAGAEFGPVPDGGFTTEGVHDAFTLSYGSEKLGKQVMDLYPGVDSGDHDAIAAHCADHMFGVHVDHASRMHAAAGHPVYRYHFRSVPASSTQTAGAFHAAEVLHVFDTALPLIPVAPDAHLLTKEMGDRWFAFAASHVPDFPGRDTWPAYDAENPEHLVLNRPTSAVEPCPAQEGLDLMRARIERLNGVGVATETIDMREAAKVSNP